jgi:hypothetical protein
MKKLALTGLALFLLLIPIANAGACDAAGIVNFTYPQRVKYGEEIEVDLKAVLWQNFPTFWSSCSVLEEVAIVPQGYYPTLALPLTPIEPAKCCPGNENFADAWVSISGFPAAQYVDTKLFVRAPSPTSYDHCSPEKKSFWVGEGYYIISVSLWSACSKDGGKLYDRKLGLIYVEGPSLPTPQSVCGNGICEPGENAANCLSDCWNSSITKEIPLKLTDILIIVGVIVVIVILYKKLK